MSYECNKCGWHTTECICKILETSEEERYESLDRIFTDAKMVCPPDEYDFRQRELLYAVASFLLEPYYIKLKVKEEAERSKSEETADVFSDQRKFKCLYCDSELNPSTLFVHACDGVISEAIINRLKKRGD